VKLLPCPFCGNCDIELVPNGIGDFSAHCGDGVETGCGASSSEIRCESRQHAAERWNRRAVDQHHLPGVDLIRAERIRGIVEEGWTHEHDDTHSLGQLGQAGACYAETAAVLVAEGGFEIPSCYVHKNWPFERKWFKPSGDPILNLVKAGALIAAEIDRLQRLQGKEAA
jgi:hypothetical protein